MNRYSNVKERYKMHNYSEVKKYIPHIIGAATGIIALSILIVVLCINSGDDGENKATSTEKSAQDNTTIDEASVEKNTTKETSKTTTDKETSDEITTDNVTTEEHLTSEAVTTKNNQVAQNTTSSKQETLENQETTVQQTTTEQQQTTTVQPTTTSPPRGENGVILEELSFTRYNSRIREIEVILVPKTCEEAKEKVDTEGALPGWGIVYNSPTVIQNNIFNNEITFQQTTESEVISIYGQALTSYTTENGKFLVYQYGYYANGVKEEIMYIVFGFAKDLDMKLGSVGINSDVTGRYSS